MTGRPKLRAAFLACVLLSGGLDIWSAPANAAGGFPSRLTDRAFWTLVSDLSEPDGHFRSDNLLSNEIWYEQALGLLSSTTKPGGAYLGVGPEQNFTYIATIKPAVAFVVDVRRGNLELQLTYKALFELSNDRPDFVARLFSRKRPAGLASTASASRIFDAFAQTQPSDDLYGHTLEEIREQLVTRHHFPLTRDDLHGIEVVLHAFYAMGPKIRYSPIGSSGGTVQPTYAELMTATDESGAARSFLADDATFAAVRDFERRNLLVPVVGNFAGPRSLRAIGQYLRRHALTVSAFYLSNVEEYLIQDGIWGTFCANAAALPLTQTSTFIRSVRTDGPSGTGTAFLSQLRPIREEVKDCSEAPRW